MAQCETCISGLGIITEVFADGYLLTGTVGPLVRTVECPECKGVGSLCSYCYEPADCDCYRPPPEPPRKRPNEDDW
jgi:hypothetical protein